MHNTFKGWSAFCCSESDERRNEGGLIHFGEHEWNILQSLFTIFSSPKSHTQSVSQSLARSLGHRGVWHVRVSSHLDGGKSSDLHDAILDGRFAPCFSFCPPTRTEREKTLSYVWKRVQSNIQPEDKWVFPTSWKRHTWLGMTLMLKMHLFSSSSFCEKKKQHLHIELLTHFYPLGKHKKKTGSDKLESKVKPESTESLRDLFGLINPDTDLLLNISPCLKLKSD